ALAGALVHFDSKALLKQADADKKNAELAHLLAFITVEDYSAVHRALAVGRALVKANPECYRVHDTLASIGGVSTQHTTSLAGFARFTESMPRRLASVPGLPRAVAGLLEASAPEPDVLAALVASADAVEPSRAVLGRVLQETRFNLIWRRVEFLEHQLSTPS